MENYEVLKPIGKGKFAIVYRAQRKGDDELGKTATLLGFGGSVLRDVLVALSFCR